MSENKVLELTVTWDAVSGQINVKHPNNKVVAYGMLEMAKEAIFKKTEIIEPTPDEKAKILQFGPHGKRPV